MAYDVSDLVTVDFIDFAGGLQSVLGEMGVPFDLSVSESIRISYTERLVFYDEANQSMG